MEDLIERTKEDRAETINIYLFRLNIIVLCIFVHSQLFYAARKVQSLRLRA